MAAGLTRGVVGKDCKEQSFSFVRSESPRVVMRSTTVAEAVGRDYKKDILRRPLGRSDSDDEINARDVPLLLPFRGIPTTVVKSCLPSVIYF